MCVCVCVKKDSCRINYVGKSKWIGDISLHQYTYILSSRKISSDVDKQLLDVPVKDAAQIYGG